VDGSGQSPVKADVLVRDRYIAAVGSFPSFKADDVLFGNEQYLSSGFVDMNASSDRTLALFSEPTFGDFLKQGVTSVLMGQCGFSLAPSVYGSLHTHQSRDSKHVANSNWRTFGEFLDTLSKNWAFGANIGSLAGHRVMREDIVHDPSKFRKLSAGELRVFRHLLLRTLEEGSFGFSSGLGYVPYTQTPYHEMRALADVVAQHKGLYAVHMRNETDGLLDSVKEVVKLAQDVSVRTIISHLRPFVGYEQEFEQALELLARKFSKAHVYFDMNPFPYSAVRADAFLPRRMQDMDIEAALSYLRDPASEKNLLQELPLVDARDAMVFRAPDMPFLRGVSLFDFAQNRHVSSKKALLEFMRATKLRGVLFYKNLNPNYIAKGLLSSQSLVSTNSSHATDVAAFRPKRATDTFPEFLRIADRAGMPIEKAVAKITSVPASLAGIEKRGMVAAGFYADLVLCSKDGSISNVFVNGRRAVADGQFKPAEATSGNVLYKRKP